jgi:hypothetical protein
LMGMYVVLRRRRRSWRPMQQQVGTQMKWIRFCISSERTRKDFVLHQQQQQRAWLNSKESGGGGGKREKKKKKNKNSWVFGSRQRDGDADDGEKWDRSRFLAAWIRCGRGGGSKLCVRGCCERARGRAGLPFSFSLSLFPSRFLPGAKGGGGATCRYCFVTCFGTCPMSREYVLLTPGLINWTVTSYATVSRSPNDIWVLDWLGTTIQRAKKKHSTYFTYLTYSLVPKCVPMRLLKTFPITPQFYPHMVCPKFNSHVYIISEGEPRGSTFICLYFCN